MPIKLPRFRRKSIGNSLDATYQAAEPESPGAQRSHSQFSFDEIERPVPPVNRNQYPQYPPQHHQQQQKFNQPHQQHHGYSAHLKYGDSTGSSSASRSNSNSGGSTGTGYYASDRQSSSSTLPSSADIPRTPPSTEDHYRPAYADSMTAKDPMAYGSAGPVARGGWVNSKSGPMSKPPSSFRMAEPPKLETTLDSEPLFGDDMFKFTSDGKRMSTIGILDSVGPKAATSLFIPTKSAPIEPVPPIPPPKSVGPTVPQSRRTLDSRIHGDNDDIYPSPISPRYGEQQTRSPSLPSPSIGNGRPSPSAKDGMYPWESRQHSEEDSLISGEKSPSPGPPAPPPKQETYQPRHNRTLTPASTFPAKTDTMDSLATPPQTGRAPKPTSKDGPFKRALGVNKRPTTTSSNGSQDEVKSSPASTVKRKEVPSPPKPVKHVESLSSGEESPLPSPIPTTTVTLSSPPQLPRVKTAPISLPSSALFTDSGSQSTSKTRPPQPARADTEDFLGSALARDAAIASSFEAGENRRLDQPRKVFTKAQFERYKAQQEEERQYQAKNGRKDESDSESDVSDDDDEVEKQRAQAKQRAKQDAHLSVYRQQMMKITGSHGTDTTNLGMTNKGASSSTPMLSLSVQMPHLSISSPSSAGDKSDGEDEEVPLGILMAHGFPNKQTGRPPTRLSNSNSSPNLRSVSGSTQFVDNGAGGSLPPFARHLPADPYFGAGLVNQTNRVSMAPPSIYGGSQRESQYIPSPQPPRPAPQGRYPTGLIGNIVRDEELRAARRGGTQHAPFYNDSTFSSGPGPVTPPMPSQNETVQLQMANQMTQMMQIQMQWMQQMSQMNQHQAQQQMMAMQGMMPGMMPGMPPMMGGNNSLMPNMMMPGQRAMSMVDTGSVPHFQPGPGMLNQQPGAGLSPGYAGSVYGHNRSSTLPNFLQPGYTPSIAPSERSNIGQPSRYRPVTYQTGSGGSSAGGAGRTGTLVSAAPPSGLKTQMAKDDTDDEDGWAEMGKKKQAKKETWRKKKEGGIRSVLNFGN
ncbi:hypothetical protein TWF694_003402 [Orbilia ellipsospora]|uniref:Uncharacterized protein n=1 Tax=Orbilia ellipsospora TaxID=2528407 RepID=A0AAV9WZB9_9PEZI